MIYVFKKLIIFIFFIFLMPYSAFTLENKILFKVENKIITSQDILNEIDYIKTLNPEILNLEKNEIIEIAKNSLLREKIKSIELEKNFNKLDVEEKYIDQAVKSIFFKKNIQNLSDLLNYLNLNNIDIDNIKNKISIEILWNQLILKKFSNQVIIDKEKINNEILNSSKEKKSYLLSEIVFTIDNNSSLNDKYLLIKKNINEKSFGNTALIYSISDTSKNGGMIGWVDENSLNEIIKSEISKIDIGKYTKPIFTPSGYLILQVNDIKIEKLETNYEEEFTKIVKIKTNQQLNQFSNIYFNKIKKNIIIDGI